MRAEANGPGDAASETTASGGIRPYKHSATPDALHCPLCGAPAKRRWRNAPAIHGMALFAFFLVAVCAFTMDRSRSPELAIIMGLISLGIILLLVWSLPVTCAVALVARPRCGHCGHLWQPHPSRGDEGSAGFPWLFALLGELILLVFLVGALAWLHSAPGLETSILGLRFPLWIGTAGLALGSGLLVQAVAWLKLRAKTPDKTRQGFALLKVSLVLGAAWLALVAGDRWFLSHTYDPVTRAPVVLDRAGLAPLPESARDVKVHAWAFMLSGSYTVRFTAEPNDIERFLADSPGLQGVPPSTYSQQRMLLRSKRYSSPFEMPDAQGNDCLEFESDAPRWFQQELRGPGRRYELNWAGGEYQGELLINDETHTVYAHVDRY